MPQSPQPATRVVERFLDYVTYDTQSDGNSASFPSTHKQLILLDRLVADLQALGLRDAVRDQYGYVFATIPATTKKKGVPTIGFIAHVDTSPEAPGAGVRPIIHKAWDGGDIVLPDDPTVVLRRAEQEALANKIGEDIITASGTTLLGADNKAGVAAIVAVAEYLLAHPEIPHGTLRLGFTPDEEVGDGTKYFDVERFAAKYAYTIDGESLGQIEAESFSADSVSVTFHGWNTHPGLAHGKMVNAIKVAADFIARLPRDRLSPETTCDRQGFVHPYQMEASVEQTALQFLIRDFDTAKLPEYEHMLRELATQTAADWPGATVQVQVTESYRNMREVIEQHPQVVENARRAIARAGIPVVDAAIRGGTDGSRLSFMGLPTPNLFVGEHNYHSRLEWISAQDLHKAVEVMVHLAQIWEEDTPA
ncbi:MAG: peptidase T [Deltaproteobacteria bacterium]|nr:peptidase T [Deltaproteobacteria bacterium]